MADEPSPRSFPVTFELTETNSLPESLIFRFTFKEAKEPVDFKVVPMKAFREAPREFTLNKTISVGPGKVTIKRVVLSPIRGRVDFQADPENPYYLKGLFMTLKDEKGQTWATENNGISGLFDETGDNAGTSMMESSYFNRPKHLWLEISGYHRVMKDQSTAIYDYEKDRFELLPDYIHFEKSEIQNGELWLILTKKTVEADHYGQLFETSYTDENGKKLEMNSQGFSNSHGEDTSTREYLIYLPIKEKGKARFKVSSGAFLEIEPIRIQIY